ncbi:hypothetical protein L1987_33260 [Smallanthus sonchifolius]|uniref:Uncharacterized protein n=1 Tax=Smallanthus sonchifolius TaxID=185202 RepID=A0ACB9HQ17_9ASTR|nr:hypothetical protein L1987_33260 [Smallanthus sonchifolius]
METTLFEPLLPALTTSLTLINFNSKTSRPVAWALSKTSDKPLMLIRVGRDFEMHTELARMRRSSGDLEKLWSAGDSIVMKSCEEALTPKSSIVAPQMSVIPNYWERTDKAENSDDSKESLNTLIRWANHNHWEDELSDYEEFN